MVESGAFDKYATAYDCWFEDHPAEFQSELEAVKRLLPEIGPGLEVGVGTGRFAAAFGISTGVEPSEALPFPDERFDFVLFVTVLCFFASLESAFQEAFRVLKASGSIVIGMIDRDSPLGRNYESRKNESRFYKAAVFRSVDAVTTGLEAVGFGGFQYAQTLFRPLVDLVTEEPVAEGDGKGAFVVVRAEK